jgi:endonuclease/exonuclease/phosphatase family metal-dependent hydrolase
VVLVAVLTALLATLAVGVAAGLIDLPGRTPDDSPVTDATITTPTPSETPARTTERIPRDRPPTVRPPMPVVAGTTLRPEVERRHQILPEQSAAELLAERAAAEAALDDEPTPSQATPSPAVPDVTVTVGSFNVLATQHTTPQGDHPSYPSASWRSPQAAGLIRAHGVDVVGTQELKPDQLNTLTRLTGMAAYPGHAFGPRDTDNSILYDPRKFEFVSGTSFTIRFMNADRPQTVLRLRERETDREMYFVNMHASAGEGEYAVSRRAGHLTAVGEINRMKREGLPIFLTGDMNDREEFYCRVVPPTGLVAAVGGSVAGGCRPAPRLAVDWVLGTPDVTFTRYWEDRSPTRRKVSDHFFISAVATIAGRG